MRHAYLAAVLVCLAACGGEEGERASGCEPGVAVSCDCDGGGTGTAVCGEDRLPGSCSCPGAVDFAPARLDFGDVPAGAAREATLLLSTDGTAAIPVADVTIEGPPAFGLTSAPAEIPPGGGGVPVVVSFRSDRPVEASGALVIRTGEGQLSVPLAARAVGSAVECTPTTLAWDGTPLGASEVREIRCTNVGVAGGDDPAVVQVAEVVTDDPEFAATSVPIRRFGPEETFSIEIRYRPVDEEEDSGTASVHFMELGTAPPGEVAIALSGTAESLPCSLEASPSPRSGATIPGVSFGSWVAFDNLRDDAGCRVAGFEPAPDCSDAFDFELPPPGEVIFPGGSLPVSFSLRSDAVGVHRCELLAIDDHGNRFSAAIEVDVTWRDCLYLVGDQLPQVSPSCGASEGEVVAENRCPVPIPIDEVRLGEGSSGAFSIGPFAPRAIAPDGSLHVPVFFDPEVEGESFEATVELYSSLDPVPWTAPIGGSSGADDLYTDRRLQNRIVPIDVLVVIDNGVNMGPEAAVALQELGHAPEALRGYDYHLAVTTTGLAPEVAGGCPGGVGGGEDGRLFPVDGSRPRVVTPATPNARAVWEQNLQVGTCHTAPARPLEAAALAVLPELAEVADDPRHPEADDGNLGFLRPGVQLVVIFIGDRDDASPGTPASYFDTLLAVKNGNRALVGAIVVAGPPSTGCAGPGGTAAAAGDRLHEFATAATAIELPVCDPAWGVLPWFDGALEDCFTVAGAPADRNGDGEVNEADLRVRVGLQEVPWIDPGSGLANWTWKRTLRSVCFEDPALPPPSALVEIERLYCPAVM